MFETILTGLPFCRISHHAIFHASSCEIHSKRIFTVYRGLFSNTGCSSARLGAAVITMIAFKVRTLNRYMETISIMVEALPPDRNRIMWYQSLYCSPCFKPNILPSSKEGTSLLFASWWLISLLWAGLKTHWKLHETLSSLKLLLDGRQIFAL